MDNLEKKEKIRKYHAEYRKKNYEKIKENKNRYKEKLKKKEEEENEKFILFTLTT